MEQIFEAVLENKPFILNVYRSVSREKIESYLYKLTYGFVGIMLEWIDRGMKDDYKEIVDRMSITLHGNIANSIHNFEQAEKNNFYQNRRNDKFFIISLVL